MNCIVVRLFTVSLLAVAASAQCFSTAAPGTFLVSGDDAVDATHRALGFAFPMAGSAGAGSFTHFLACTNGWILLTDGITSAGIPSTTDYSATGFAGAAGNFPRIAPYWGDLNSSGAGNGVFFDNTTNPGVSCTITWKNVVDFGNAVQKSFQIELFATGVVKLSYSGGMNVNSGGTKTAGLTCSNGTALPAVSNFVPGPAASVTGAMRETFAVGTFDLGGRSLTFTPAGAGWGEAVTCTTLSASHTSYGSGCYSISDSFYQLLASATPAAAALTGNSLVLTPTIVPAGQYTASWGGGAYIAPTGGAVNVFATAQDDSEQLVTPSIPFPAPTGAQASVRVHSNGLVSWGAAGQTFPGTQNYVPTAAGFLAAANAGVWSWHDYNEAEAGSGRIKREEVLVGADTVLCLTWDNVENYASPEGPNPSTMQIQLNLTTGVVKFVWPSIDANSSSTFGSAHLVGYSPAGLSNDGGSIDLATALPITTSATNLAALSLAASPGPISTPVTGTLVTYTINNIPLACPAPAPVFNFGIVLMSLGQDAPGSSLSGMGMPGCNQHITSIDVALSYVGNTASQNVTFQVPAGVPYGFQFYAQATALICPNSLPNGQNAFGATVSNGVASFVSFL